MAWENHYDAGKCDPVQSQFFQPKPVVEFFDTQADPWQVKNLAGAAGASGADRETGEQVEQWMIETRDLGLVPEPLFCELAGPGKKFKTLHEFGRSDDYPVERVLAAAKTASLGETAKVKDYLAMMKDGNPIIRHWGAYGVFLARPDDAAAQEGAQRRWRPMTRWPQTG